MMYTIVWKGKMISHRAKEGDVSYSPIFSSKKAAVDFINEWSIKNWDDIIPVSVRDER